MLCNCGQIQWRLFYMIFPYLLWIDESEVGNTTMDTTTGDAEEEDDEPVAKKAKKKKKKKSKE